MKDERGKRVNTPKDLVRIDEWQKKNPDKHREASKRWRDKNKDKTKAYYEDNKERILKITKEYKEKRKDWYKEYHRGYYLENKEKWKRNDLLNLIKKRQRRLEIIKYYGNKCACCGETTHEFLAIDHINGGGNKHRKKIGDVYRWLIKNNFPDGFRVLCHNCNFAIGHYEICPHEKSNFWNVKNKAQGRYRLRKIEAVKHYGNECAICGEREIEFLSLDHVDGNGREHRERLGNTIRGNAFYKYLIDNDFPKDFNLRVLCMNCNSALGFYGYHPNERMVV